jgi:hypothetical protein
MNQLLRHGDVALIPAKLPKGVKGKLLTELVIAFGETTGHNHTLTAEPETKFKVVETSDGTRYFVLNKTAQLTHPEHKTITVLPGVYVQGQEREKDWFSLSVRKVVD